VINVFDVFVKNAIVSGLLGDGAVLTAGFFAWQEKGWGGGQIHKNNSTKYAAAILWPISVPAAR
jgi:hypothetical protein